MRVLAAVPVTNRGAPSCVGNRTRSEASGNLRSDVTYYPLAAATCVATVTTEAKVVSFYLPHNIVHTILRWFFVHRIYARLSASIFMAAESRRW